MTSVACHELIFWIKFIFMHYQNETGKISSMPNLLCFQERVI